jgi:SAM-dependent methyltransferase
MEDTTTNSARNANPEGALPTIDEQRQFWNSHWQRSEERKVLNSWTERRSAAVLETIRMLGIDRPRILDFGCGNGWFTERVADLGETYAIDLSPEAIAVARTRRSDVTFMCDNLYRAPLPTNFFDVVVSQEVISHVEDQTKFINRAAEVLKPAGHFIITSGNRFVMDRLGDVGWHNYPPEHIENELTCSEMRKLLRPRFNVLRMRTIIPHGSRGILRVVNSYKLARLLSPVVRSEKLNQWKEWAGFGWQMVVLAQKKA